MQLVEQVQAGLTRRQILVMRKPGDILQRSTSEADESLISVRFALY